ncbi:SLC32A [Mytilus edulis]|uniref:SLC32A n=1 Tax=Mytilus edulis TaxID=6550 RepID=A0A8S3SE48_MYTED|nr:SLC32A [Mytilus edulis]
MDNSSIYYWGYSRRRGIGLAKGCGRYRPIGVGATLKDNSHNKGTTVHSDVGIQKFSSAFGTMVFAVSGHSVFPTIITDMEKKEDFKIAALLGYGIVLMMYIPTAMSGYFVYGSNVDVNIIKSISAGPLAYVVEILVTLHLLLGFIIYMNPVCQQFEAKVGVPKAFTWKRCIVRPLIVLVVLFIAESVPHFGSILSLVGGSTTTLLSYVFPCLFYMKLCKSSGNKTVDPSSSSHRVEFSAQNDDAPSSSKQNVQAKFDPQPSSELILIPLWQKVLNIEIICIGIIGGLAATVSAIIAIATPDSLSVPCYVSLNGAGS